MHTDEGPSNGWQCNALFLGKVGVADETARMKHRMLCHQILNPLLSGCIERVICCAQIGEFGFPSSRRQLMRLIERKACRARAYTSCPYATAGFPAASGARSPSDERISSFSSRFETSATSLFPRRGLSILADRSHRGLHRPEQAAERNLLFVGEWLVPKDQHRVMVEGLRDLAKCFLIDRNTQINT